MDSLNDEIESILFIAREVMGECEARVDSCRRSSRDFAVYRVPPATSTAGVKAADWDVEQFIWKGRLRVIETGSKCELKLEVRPISFH